MARRQLDLITVTGVNGDTCIVSDPQLTWGPYLSPGSKGLYDMPIKTNYGKYAFGQFFQSWQPQLRNVVWTVNIINPETGSDIDQDSDLWHTIYSRWKAMFAPDKDATVTYLSIDGPRTLGLKTFKEPVSCSTLDFEGKDPHLWAYGSVVQTMAAEIPFYVGPPQKFSWQTSTPGTYWFTLPYFNPSDIEIWPEWFVTGGATWALPDYSFGSEVFGRGLADIGKTVPLNPLLLGEDCDIQTRPDLETFITALETPFGNRNPGKDFEYAIPPGRGDSTAGCVVRTTITNPAGGRCELTLPRWYSEPFGSPRIV